jgi:hypothetical protein
MKTFVRNGNVISVYLNGVYKINVTVGGSTSFPDLSSPLIVGLVQSTSYGKFDFDEFSVWKGRALSPTEINETLYNDGAGITYLPDNPPSITLNSPSSANYTSPQSLTINFTALDDINLANVTLWVNGVLNQTNSSGLNNSVYLFPITLGDGTYSIYGKATDNLLQETVSATIIVNISSPLPIEESNSVNLYGVMSSTGAGLGMFLETMAVALPILLIGLSFIGIIVAIGWQLYVLTKYFSGKK